MHVKYGLSGSRIAIHHNPVAFIASSFLFGQLFGNEIQIADFLDVGFSQIVDGRNMLARNNQYMCRCLRIDIANAKNLI